jgi:hypothetical protein
MESHRMQQAGRKYPRLVGSRFPGIKSDWVTKEAGRLEQFGACMDASRNRSHTTGSREVQGLLRGGSVKRLLRRSFM